jgi:hypothetical protein
MTDRRGVSFTLNYVLTLGIAALLVTGLIVAAGDYVGSQRESVVRSELEVVGHQLAAALEQADRLVRAGDTEELRLNHTAPAEIAQSTYTVEVDPGSPESDLHLNATELDVTVTVEAETTTSLAATAVEGGSVTIEYNTTTANELEVTDD